LVDVSVFDGSDWEETGTRTARGAPYKEGIERAGTSFASSRGGGAQHDVYRFLDEDDARRGFSSLEATWSWETAGSPDWIERPRSSDAGSKFDEYALTCRVSVDTERELCRFSGRRDAYVTEFVADMIAINHDSLEVILADIADKMDLCYLAEVPAD
jgi:hypothetical protein